MPVSEESQPLLPELAEPSEQDAVRSKYSVTKIYICVCIISLSIAFTWVPMIYVFRLMTCDEYYKHNPAFEGSGDRCNLSDIEASTARAVTLLGTTTTIFGVMNLFITNIIMKKFGVKTALIAQTVWPALRLCCQIVAVTIGAGSGMAIIQATQFICMMGGPAGYLLVTNTYATEMVEKYERTAVLGILSGCVMFGTAVGYLLGGLIGDIFGIRRPFEVACILMVVSTIYTIFFLPYIAPEQQPLVELKKKASQGLSAIFAPVKQFAPQLFQLPNGKVNKRYNVLLLGLGVFFGVLATGFIPILIQMYATNAFDFGPTENGYLMSFNSLIRGLFLIFAFPRIISWGRKRHAQASMLDEERVNSEGAASVPTLPTSPEDFEAMPALQSEQEPTAAPKIDVREGDVTFDLLFLKCSLVADGLLTGLAAFSRQGWHIYLAAFMLPLASGSSSAAKGVMMEMCPASQRADALSAMTLVEMIATLSTMSVFGLVFSVLAEIGKPHLVFICNAGVAVLAVCILAFASFPPKGSKRIQSSDVDSPSG